MPGIIVGIDGSAGSRRALEWAVSEAAIRRAPLTVLTAVQPAMECPGFGGQAWYPHDPDLAGHAAKEAHEEADSVLGKLGAGSRPPSVSVQAVVGPPASEILRAAQGADLIVVGSRGAGGFKKLLLGSVSQHLTHHARCPVVVIPLDAEPAPVVPAQPGAAF
jgi:nucleotide-binding universal stress UspA family protein